MKNPDQSDLSIALSQKKATKKISLLRGLIPEINQAMHRGLSKKEIWDALQSAGMNMNYKLFINYLSRIQKRERPAPAPEPINETNEKATSIPAQHQTRDENETRGMSSAHAALAEIRQQSGEIDYSKMMRDHLKSQKKGTS